MENHKNRAFVHRLRFALAGIMHAVRAERSLRTQILALLCVTIALCVLQPPPIWCALVALASSCVLAAELFNTAVERLADHLHPDLHPEIRIVKDCAAAGVLLVSAGALGVAIALAVDLLRHSPP